jgi:uncharacterized protein YllA (UPF0747 family)
MAMVLDPHELHSFMRALPVFDELGICRPTIWPYSGATILDARSRRILEKYRLKIKELYCDEGDVIAKVLQKMPRSVPERLRSLVSDVEGTLADLGMPPSSDGKITGKMASCKERIVYQIERLGKRYETARLGREQAIHRQIRKARNSLAPDGRLQERGLSAIHFMLRYSTSVIQLLYDKLDIMKLEHQLISMD